jgi:hypothetical protein
MTFYALQLNSARVEIAHMELKIKGTLFFARHSQHEFPFSQTFNRAPF